MLIRARFCSSFMHLPAAALVPSWSRSWHREKYEKNHDIPWSVLIWQRICSVMRCQLILDLLFLCIFNQKFDQVFCRYILSSAKETIPQSGESFATRRDLSGRAYIDKRARRHLPERDAVGALPRLFVASRQGVGERRTSRQRAQPTL